MARSECENDYKFYSSKLSEPRPLAVEYLAGIDKSHILTYAFNEKYNQPSYDEVTSNLSEAANSWLGNAVRSSYPLEAFEQCFVKVVQLFAERRRTSSRQKGPAFSDFLLPTYKKKLDGIMALTKTLQILPCLDGQYMVRFTDISSRPDHAHLWRTVNLIEKECTCRRWQDLMFPCVHAVKTAIHHGIHASELFAGRNTPCRPRGGHITTSLCRPSARRPSLRIFNC
ncbi:hypothetical protein PHYSODRAFT_508953 [Phytophthora sojae]|uniref:SWIM-type domain-containing protein n=1 Tax=Phytophthora sojae (strain P6497) TaxID=1094619 RepID=G4ZL62_PHYSP|nr:hypothetical protein PHYSODRAFT_508953 [Phytophthora sojae]EGZ15576.1 hypothetical protein PHYSODRAFT_508953 [Phytophthora sojae]|eukprot:XP_009529325.1 hypothetical protein PHYSODRAFT_508953 [Phytophthora sojae]